MAAILDTGRHWWTQFWKGTTQGSFQQSLVEIGTVVSEEKIFLSISAVLYPRWPPWLKIEISLNGQNCSILSQKVPKFELYKHNDELFNIYYGIFLWTLYLNLLLRNRWTKFVSGGPALWPRWLHSCT
jgi:hypothetical protein